MDVRNRRVSSTHSWDGEAFEIYMSSSGELEVWAGTTKSCVMCFAAAILTFAAAFFFGFPESRLSGCCGFRLGHLMPGRFSGGGHFMLRWRFLFWLRRGIKSLCGVVVALTTRLLERRDFKRLLGPSARQWARPAELLKRRGGLWWC